MNYDVFNGDADGIFALHQLRLQNPDSTSTLITGVKRDIKLLQNIRNCNNSYITTLDISLDSNRESLETLLKDESNKITYIDHHFAGDIPDSKQLTTHINTSAETCTSLIVNDLLDNQYADWAICGAFGDNLHQSALRLCEQLEFSSDQVQQLQEIGELFNYNGYGNTLDDLHFHPADLYKAIQSYTNVFEFLAQAKQLAILRNAYESDMQKALSVNEHPTNDKNRVFFFPNESWARRVGGVFSNMKAREQQDSAHALITENSDQTFRISVRAPLTDRRDAVTLCNEFPTGGGREAAAGINNLPAKMLDSFLDRFSEIYK